MAALLAVAAAAGTMAAEPHEKRAQDPEPEATDGRLPPPLRWLYYSRERFRALMRMLAERAARTEAKRAADTKAADEAKQAAEARAAAEAKRAAEEAERVEKEARQVAAVKAADAARRAAEAKAAEEAKHAEEARWATEAKAAEAARRVTEAKAAEEARGVAEAKAVEKARRVAEAKAAEEARRVAEAKAAEEATRVAEDKAAEEAKRVVEETQRVEKARREAAARLPCANAGAKVAGGGWYVVQPGDSLWRISRMHYGYGKAYWRIWSANRRRVTSPRRIFPCQRLYIPRMRGEGPSPLQGVRVALEPLIRRRGIDTGLPGFVE